MTFKSKKEKYLDAVRAMYGFNKKEAAAYIRAADPASLDAIRVWWINQHKLAFYND